MENTDMTPSRTLLLWLAALMVTWISGIEPTWRKIEDSASKFQMVNRQRHETELKVVDLQRQIDDERRWLQSLRAFAKDYPSDEMREEHESQLFTELRQRQAEVAKSHRSRSFALTELPSERPCDSFVHNTQVPEGKTDAEKRLSSAIDKLKNFCLFESALKQLSERETSQTQRETELTKAGQIALAKAVEDARGYAEKVRASSDVNFELLGLKFTAAPLLASSLWSGFAFAWLFVAYLEGGSASAVADSSNRGNSHERDLRLLMLLTILTWLMQLRVSWVGLRITALQGEMNWRALVACILCILVVASAYVIARIFESRTIHEQPGESSVIENRLLVLGIIFLSGLIAFVIWRVPGRALQLAQRAMPIIPALSLLPLLFSQHFSLRQRHDRSSVDLSRRRSILIWVGSVTVVGLAALGWRESRTRKNYQQAVRDPKNVVSRNDRAVRKTEVRMPTAGFYQGSRNGSGRNSGRQVIYYISKGGLVAPHIHLPKKIIRVPEPIYVWSGMTLGPNSVLWLAKSVDKKSSEIESVRLDGVHVALNSASWSFEHAALDLLAKGILNNDKVLHACTFLLNGIRHDLLLKRRFGHKRSAPSYRLYDLAAGLAVRFGLPQVLYELEAHIKDAKYELIFKSRMEKWNDLSSNWSRRWRSHRRPMKWHCDKMVAVF